MLWGHAFPFEVEPRHIGRHRAPAGTPRTTPRRRLTLVEVECAALMSVLTHLVDGRSADDAWALGEIEAVDMLNASAVA